MLQANLWRDAWCRFRRSTHTSKESARFIARRRRRRTRRSGALDRTLPSHAIAVFGGAHPGFATATRRRRGAHSRSACLSRHCLAAHCTVATPSTRSPLTLGTHQLEGSQPCLFFPSASGACGFPRPEAARAEDGVVGDGDTGRVCMHGPRSVALGGTRLRVSASPCPSVFHVREPRAVSVPPCFPRVPWCGHPHLLGPPP